ncbi:MAG: hypothetical protein GC164_03990 [Phycisphaera sp.]|nr:hypothetical protein [Phycisphaera sp.]
MTCLCLFGATLLSGPANCPADEAPAQEQPTLKARCGLPFRDNAVLQQLIPLPIWGTSLPGAKVTVGFMDQTKPTLADARGVWRVVLEPMRAAKLRSVHDAPEGHTLRIVCEMDGQQATTEVNNMIVGEVWLCSGQSNMAGKLRTTRPTPLPDFPDEKPDYPALRQMVSDIDAPWLICTGQNASEVKKVCFYFARSLLHDTLVPIGIINAAVGGSNIESWLYQPPDPTGKHFTRYIEPIVGLGMRGVVWYQGESNVGDKRDYAPKLRSLIVGWRKVWEQPDSKDAQGPRGDFSFYFVQLPGIGNSTRDNPEMGDGRAEIRQAQYETLALSHTGMAVTIDVGDVREHPPNKFDTGIRLARLASYFDYGLRDRPPTGPLYTRAQAEGDKLRIQFEFADHGLMFATKNGTTPPHETPDADLDWLSIQDQNGSWHWAKGTIDGQDLIVRAEGVTHPVAARYAYTNQPTGTLLYNKDGLPASPFTTCGYDAPHHE